MIRYSKPKESYAAPKYIFFLSAAVWRGTSPELCLFGISLVKGSIWEHSGDRCPSTKNRRCMLSPKVGPQFPTHSKSGKERKQRRSECNRASEKRNVSGAELLCIQGRIKLKDSLYPKVNLKAKKGKNQTSIPSKLLPLVCNAPTRQNLLNDSVKVKCLLKRKMLYSP